MDRGKEIVAKGSWERDPGKGVLGKESWQRDPQKGVLAKGSWKRGPGKRILGKHFPRAEQVLPSDPELQGVHIPSWIWCWSPAEDAQNFRKNPRTRFPKFRLPNPRCTKPQFPTPTLPALFPLQCRSLQPKGQKIPPRNFQSRWKGSKGWLFQMTPENAWQL